MQEPFLQKKRGGRNRRRVVDRAFFLRSRGVRDEVIDTAERKVDVLVRESLPGSEIGIQVM